MACYHVHPAVLKGRHPIHLGPEMVELPKMMFLSELLDLVDY